MIHGREHTSDVIYRYQFRLSLLILVAAFIDTKTCLPLFIERSSGHIFKILYRIVIFIPTIGELYSTFTLILVHRFSCNRSSRKHVYCYRVFGGRAA